MEGLSRSTAGYQRLLVVSSGGVQAAIPVHDVFRIPDILPDAVEALPTSVSHAQKQYLEGIINTSGIAEWKDAGEDTITLVDVVTLFDTPAIRELRGTL